MDVKEDYDYAAEYAKSNRSQCKGCKSLIAKGSLRIALMVQSPFFDGKQPQWHHYSCFFENCRPSNVGEVKNFNSLRFPDQEKIQAQIDRFSSGLKQSKKGPKIISKTLKDFVVQYASSNRSKCKDCNERIEKDEIRFSHKKKHPGKPQLGVVDHWHHVGCFLKRLGELGWQDSFTAEMLTGFALLDADDKAQVKELLVKKRKSQSEKEPSGTSSTTTGSTKEKELKGKIKKQSILMWSNIDKLKSLDFRKDFLIEMLKVNKQRVPTGMDAIYLAIGDGMTFGALPSCPECQTGQLVVSSNGYHCTGQISEWTSCSYRTDKVARLPWSMPKHVKEADVFLGQYRYRDLERVFPPAAAPMPLKQKKILLIGKLSKSKGEIKEMVEKLGGTVTTSVSKAHFAVSTTEEVQRFGKKISDTRVQDIYVVSEDLLQAVIDCPEVQTLLSLLKKFSIANWGSEQLVQIGKRAYPEKNVEPDAKKLKIFVKSGAAVDPESGLEETGHVLVNRDMKYTATLAMVDMKQGTNSYYKLQLIGSNSGKSFYIFRSWGRVGTSVGGTKLEKFYSKENAINNFNELYSEKTGNEFGVKSFKKQPRKFYPLDIDYGEEDEKSKQLQTSCTKSVLPEDVQHIIKMIFNIESMKKAMVEFEIDLNKMPLGKLSKRQIQMAYAVLTEAAELVEKAVLAEARILDCSNRFYTLIPHDFGMRQPPLLDSLQMIKSKVEMIDSLLDIAVAYNLMQGDGDYVKTEQEELDPIDTQYKKLKCDMKPLSQNGELYKTIVEMVKNTHAKTHSWYGLEVENIFELDRKGEQARYRPFKKLHNRRLLWHGSRVTNYAGILSQGLRIAPPEAPVTGYMFGKGIYFADMVSKSANYCHADQTEATGLLLLAEVALGNMYELCDAKDIRKLPKGKHSVKGVGSTTPDQSKDVVLEDGAIAHLGCGTDSCVDRTSLLYNEYIVYDAAQVCLKYLVKTKFVMQNRW